MRHADRRILRGGCGLRTVTASCLDPISAPKWLTSVKGGSMAAAVNEGADGTSGDSGSTYTWKGSHYAYNYIGLR